MMRFTMHSLLIGAGNGGGLEKLSKDMGTAEQILRRYSL